MRYFWCPFVPTSSEDVSWMVNFVNDDFLIIWLGIYASGGNWVKYGTIQTYFQ
jgi:hypothetical protein